MNRLKLSWKWQLVLVMVLVGSLALGSFIVVAWQSVRLSGLNKLDAELMSAAITEGRPLLARIRPATGQPLPPHQPPFPRERPEVDSGNAYAFHDLNTGSSESSTGWPSELGIPSLALRVMDLYVSSRLEFPQLPILPGPVSGSPDAWNRRPPPPPGGQPLPRLEPVVYDLIQIQNQDWRLMGFSNGREVFMAIRPMTAFTASMAAYWRAVSLALPVSLIFIGGAAWFLARQALKPVKRLSAAASRITAEEMEARLEMLGEPPEFKQLITVYNGMLDRLEASFKQARRFSADAAHELNTPLTILQGHLDALLQRESDPEEQADLTIALEETQHLREIIRKLHLLSQADAGNLPMEPQAVELSALIEEVLEDARTMAPGITFKSQFGNDLQIQGDPNLLRQLVFNLISNAIKYNRPDGLVQIRLLSRERSVCLDITNTGSAIRHEDTGRLFERFFRGDPARDARIPGRGLGLALALEFAHAHGGHLGLSENQEDQITFRLELPKPVTA